MKEKMDNKNIISLEMPKTQMISVFASSLFIFILALILWKQQEFDFTIVLMHNNLFENNILLNFLKLVSRFGMGFISLLYCPIMFISYKNNELKSNRPLFQYILLVFAVGSISGDLMKELFARARPAIQLSGQIAHNIVSDTSSFPSGHATKSMSLALPFILMASNKNTINIIFKVILLLSSTLVCYSRIALQKHFPSDILAGVAVALLAVVLGFWIVNFIYQRKMINADKLQSMSLKLGFVFIALSIVLSII
jgi:undecaprenyl-diphosphatase